MKLIANIVLFQFCWFASVAGAVSGKFLLGPALVIVSSALQNLKNPQWKKEGVFLLLVTIAGSAFDLLGVKVGAFSFNAIDTAWGYPLWMSALWLNFATLFSLSLAWMQRRYLLGAVFGFVGGPLSYYAGQTFGAIQLGEDLVYSLLVIGAMWAIATPAILLLHSKIFTSAT